MDKNTAQNIYEDVKSGVEAIENNDMEMFPKIKSVITKIPVFFIVPVVYVALGMVTNLWHPLWLLFFLIPIHIWYSLNFSIKQVSTGTKIPYFLISQIYSHNLT